ncbi:rho GTPase-activating protein 100F-like protein [Leptotrombidium deliense]|uniref:Rho GTPase-activating protein 100F-like protein n=1 Tax=Leptotrombidium deliense TaxID=299467 RepID=A0A443SLA7_9ACAR|nr:rho GTPase-activating protein 100F-like protein [Leptotrombidium deliense]
MHQRIIGEGTSFGYAQHPQYQYYQHQPGTSHHNPFRRTVHFQNTYHDPSDRGRLMPEMVLQSDFRKISGISSEVFRQIEAVEKEFDATTFEAVEKRGEMLIRVLDPRQLGRAGAEAGWRYLSAEGGQSVQFVEIVKRPGQTLGLYIREGDGFRVHEGVFISRIALESPVYNSGLLKVGDEILAVNLVDVRRMSLDDVVIIMSIPRRLVLTIRTRTHRDGVHSSVDMMTSRRSYGDEYRQPPVVVVKKDLTEDDGYLQDDVSSNRESENGHLLQARLKGLPAEIPPVAISLHSGNSMMFADEHGVYYNRPGGRVSRDDSWSQLQQRNIEYQNARYGVITRQPHSLQRQYPRTIENLAEHSHQYGYSGYTSDVPTLRRSAMQVTNASVHRPMLERSSSVRQRLMDEYASAGALRRGRLLRTESDNRIHPTASDYFIDQYSRPVSRSNLRSQTPTGYIGLSQMHGIRRRNEDLRQSLSTHGISSLMRRRRFTDGSVSDTEVDSISSRPIAVRRNVGRYTPRGRATRDLFQNRSHSLPRTMRTEPLSEYRYSKPSASPFRPRMHQKGPQSVRFEKMFGYDEDSDGAVSAPELPDERRARRMLGKHCRRGQSPNDYSSDEYRQWLRRAPSTSAIYETIRRAGGGASASTLPSGLSSTSLYRIAHSAESLLDTIRMEQQKSLLENLYANRIAGKTSPLPSMLTKRDYSNDSLSARQQHHRNRAHLRSQSTGIDYLRTIPNPTPVKPSDHERMHLLTLNPREFFKYRYEKPIAQETATTNDVNASTVNENNTTSTTTANHKPQSIGFTGILWVHLLAGRGLRSVSVPANNRDLYCVIESDRMHKARTVVRTGESSFDWDEIFELDLFETKEVSFLLYSWDPQSKHKLCYKGVINLISLSLNETPVHSLALKMEPKGTVYVKLRYKDPHLAFQRSTVNTSLHSTAIFGVDLETVVNRENSGFNVPLIVKRCVEEIERRGIDLVGIYRLCGSAVRKKMLRDAFDKNAWIVDLSAEHVPDINVITSELIC